MMNLYMYKYVHIFMVSTDGITLCTCPYFLLTANSLAYFGVNVCLDVKFDHADII